MGDPVSQVPVSQVSVSQVSEDEIDLRELFASLWAGKVVIGIVTALALAGAVAYALGDDFALALHDDEAPDAAPGTDASSFGELACGGGGWPLSDKAPARAESTSNGGGAGATTSSSSDDSATRAAGCSAAGRLSRARCERASASTFTSPSGARLPAVGGASGKAASDCDTGCCSWSHGSSEAAPVTGEAAGEAAVELSRSMDCSIEAPAPARLVLPNGGVGEGGGVMRLMVSMADRIRGGSSRPLRDQPNEQAKT